MHTHAHTHSRSSGQVLALWSVFNSYSMLTVSHTRVYVQTQSTCREWPSDVSCLCVSGSTVWNGRQGAREVYSWQSSQCHGGPPSVSEDVESGWLIMWDVSASSPAVCICKAVNHWNSVLTLTKYLQWAFYLLNSSLAGSILLVWL